MAEGSNGRTGADETAQRTSQTRASRKRKRVGRLRRTRRGGDKAAPQTDQTRPKPKQDPRDASSAVEVAD